MSTAAAQTNPIRARRDEEKLQRRNEILDAAEAVIRKHGWENADFGKIAKLARLSRSLLYTYFATRDHLFHAICERGLEALEHRFVKALATHSRGIDQVMAMGRAYWAFSRENAFYFELLSQFQAKSWNPEEHVAEEESANLHGSGCLRMLAQAIAPGVADGTVRKSVGNPGPASFTIWAFTHGVIQIATRKEFLYPTGPRHELQRNDRAQSANAPHRAGSGVRNGQSHGISPSETFAGRLLTQRQIRTLRQHDSQPCSSAR